MDWCAKTVTVSGLHLTKEGTVTIYSELTSSYFSIGTEPVADAKYMI